MSMKHSNLKNFIEELIKEVETELDESNVTGNIDGYQTPNAFSDGGSKDKNRKKKIATQFGMKIVGKMDESFMSDLDIIKKGSKDITDFVKRVLSDKQFKDVRTDKEFHKYLKSFYNESVNEGIIQDREKQLEKLPKGTKVSGGGYGPFVKTHSNSFKDSKSGKLYHSAALASFIGRFKDFKINEAYKGNQSDFKTDIVNALDNVGISPKAIKKISKKGKGFEVRMSSYMSNKDAWEKLGDVMGAKLVDFQKGSINVGLYESVNEGMVRPRMGHKFYQLTKDAKVEVDTGRYITGKKGAYLIDYFDNIFYLDMKAKIAYNILKIKDQSDLGWKRNFVEVDKAPELKDWKSYIKEGLNETKSKRPVNRWLELKNDESMHANKKLAVGLKELKYQLAEVEKFFTWYNKIKTMNELDSSDYWKRTNNHIYKIKERILNIAKTIQEIEK